MKRGNMSVLYILLFVLALFLAACGGTRTEREVSLENEDSDSESIKFDLSETHDFDRFGISITHPAGWPASTQEPVTFINELQSDHDVAFNDDQSKLEGYQVVLAHSFFRWHEMSDKWAPIPGYWR